MTDVTRLSPLQQLFNKPSPTNRTNSISASQSNDQTNKLGVDRLINDQSPSSKKSIAPLNRPSSAAQTNRTITQSIQPNTQTNRPTGRIFDDKPSFQQSNNKLVDDSPAALLGKLSTFAVPLSMRSHWPAHWQRQARAVRWKRTNKLSDCDIRPVTAVDSSNHVSIPPVSELHGFLRQKPISELLAQTNYNRAELYTVFLRFKSLCNLSKDGPYGIDADTFARGVQMLSVEDTLFVNRVFSLVDTDNSNSIEWEEFLVAMAALSSGSAEIKAKFALQVYDIDGDGKISVADLRGMFEASSMLAIDQSNNQSNIDPSSKQSNKPSTALQVLSADVIDMFVAKVFEEFGAAESGEIGFDQLLDWMKGKGANSDIWETLGRSMNGVIGRLNE